jgi:hypothetical protein
MHGPIHVRYLQMFLHKIKCVCLYHCKFKTAYQLTYSPMHKRCIIYDGLFYMPCLWLIFYCEICGSQIGGASNLSLCGVWRCVIESAVLRLQRIIEPSSSGSSSVVAESWKLCCTHSRNDSDRTCLRCCPVRAWTRIRCGEGVRRGWHLCSVTLTDFYW